MLKDLIEAFPQLTAEIHFKATVQKPNRTSNKKNFFVAMGKRIQTSVDFLSEDGSIRACTAHRDYSNIEDASQTGSLPMKAVVNLERVMEEWPRASIAHVVASLPPITSDCYSVKK